jgi:CheY-like chemotaxis protein/Tfp pilus assembly protein PilF
MSTDNAGSLRHFFYSIESQIEVRNLTSFTNFKTSPETALVQIDETSLILEAPPRSCTAKHHLLISIILKNPDTEFSKSISFTGRVTQVQPSKAGKDRIIVELVQFDRREWDQVQEVFTERQDAINNFLESVQGRGVTIGKSITDKAQEDALFREFLEDRKILIVDPNEAALMDTRRIFSELDGMTFHILFADSFNEAEEKIRTEKPEIILTEFTIGKNCGIDLKKLQSNANGDSGKSVFIVMTTNTAQVSVAKAAEEDVDAYLLKPFSPKNLRRTILQVAMARLNPPEHVAAIEAGKTELEQGKVDEAEKHFQEALALDKRSALACYYLGQVAIARKQLDQAKSFFQQGLSFSKLHFRCMEGSFDVNMKSQHYAEAYDVINRMSHYFPPNSKRLSEMLRLAVINQRYEDVERYYVIFKDMDQKDQTLFNYVSAALVVCGKYYLRTHNRARALEVLEKASSTSLEQVHILREIVQTLLDHRLTQKAKGFLTHFPAATRQSEDYLVLRFQIENTTGDMLTILTVGRSLLADGITNPKLYEIMVHRLKEAKCDDEAKELAKEAVQKFPDLAPKLGFAQAA